MAQTYHWSGVMVPPRGGKPRRVSGVELTSGTASDLSQELLDRGIHVSAPPELQRGFNLFRFLHKVSVQDQLMLFESLAFLAQKPLAKALTICAQRSRDDEYATAIAGLASDVSRGQPIYAGMERRPRDFSSLQTAMVKAGYEAGALPATFDNLASMLQTDYTTGTSIRDAMLGPMFLAGLAFASVLFMLVWFVPQMQSLLDAIHTPLPWPTVLVLFAAKLATNVFLWIVAGAALVGAVFGWRALMAEPRFAVKWDTFLSNIWVMGPLMEKNATARIARVLGVVIKAVSPSRAVALLVPLALSTRHRLALEEVLHYVTEGIQLSRAFDMVNAFDPMLVQYLEIGEEGAKIPEACERVAQFLEREVQRGTTALTASIEPALTIAVSLVFTLTVIALYLPYLSVIENLSQMK